MKLKEKPTDFKVREILRDEFLQQKGAHCVYRVTKRKLTSLEAAQHLADLSGVAPGQVSMAGLKDRQGVTEQYMSIPRGKPVRAKDGELIIESVGFAANELTSADSVGNGFDIVVRDLGDRELRRSHASLPAVREHGLPNYFDDQRFGNLRHRQGWIALDLARGQYEAALKRLLTSVSEADNARFKTFKSAVFRHWGDWRSCRDIAGRFGQHHSVFEHLKKNEDDFAGAFRFISSRIRLIHLYAWQSHVWNRAVARAMEEHTPEGERFAVHIREGKLVFPKQAVFAEPEWQGMFPLPGRGLAGVDDPHQRALFEAVLVEIGLTPEEFRIEGVPGFALKPEPRPLVVHPKDLRVRPAEDDSMNKGQKLVRLRFSLPRGSYATLVVRRLFGSGNEESKPRTSGLRPGPKPGKRGAGRRDSRGPRGPRDSRGPRDKKR